MKMWEEKDGEEHVGDETERKQQGGDETELGAGEERGSVGESRGERCGREPREHCCPCLTSFLCACIYRSCTCS